MLADSWQNVRLPARAATSDNFLKLTGKGVDLFVSYTAPLGWESDEADKFKRTLLVHSMVRLHQPVVFTALPVLLHWARCQGYPYSQLLLCCITGLVSLASSRSC